MVKIEMHVSRMDALRDEFILLLVTRLVNKTSKECYPSHSRQNRAFAQVTSGARSWALWSPGFENGSICFENGTILPEVLSLCRKEDILT